MNTLDELIDFLQSSEDATERPVDLHLLTCMVATLIADKHPVLNRPEAIEKLVMMKATLSEVLDAMEEQVSHMREHEVEITEFLKGKQN